MTAPTVQTVEAEAVTNTEAILRGYCWTPGSDTDMYVIFRWKKSGGDWEYGDYIQVTASNVPGYFIRKCTGLDADSNYEFQICGREGDNWNYGNSIYFKTRAAAPDGTAGHYWVEGDYWCYLDDGGYKRKIKGEG